MFDYYSAYVSCFLAAIFLSTRSKLSLRMQFLLGLSLLSFVGLRFATTDYFNYFDMYKRTEDFSQLGLLYHHNATSRPIESLFSFIILSFKGAAYPFEAFIFFAATLSLCLKFFSFQKMSTSFALSVLLYVGTHVFMDLEQIRAGLAAGFVLIALLMVHRKQPILFCLFILLAAQTHLLSLALFPLYPLIRFERERITTTIFVLSLSFLFFLDGTLVARTLLVEVLRLPPTFQPLIYLQNPTEFGRNLFGGSMFFLLAIASLAIIFRPSLEAANSYNRTLVPAFLYTLALSFVLFDFGIVSNRMIQLICIPTACVFLPSFVPATIRRDRPLVLGALCVFAFLTFYVNVCILDESYQSIVYLSAETKNLR